MEHLNLGIYYGFHKSCTQSFLNIYHKIVLNYVIISFKLFGEKRFLNSVKVFLTSTKSINIIQKYPRIIESYACFLKMFVFMFLLPINVLISFGICSTPKLSK